MSEQVYHQVRCEICHARLFDTDGVAAEDGKDRVEVVIKCWRCGSICAVYLAEPDGAAKSVIYCPQG